MIGKRLGGRFIMKGYEMKPPLLHISSKTSQDFRQRLSSDRAAIVKQYDRTVPQGTAGSLLQCIWTLRFPIAQVGCPHDPAVAQPRQFRDHTRPEESVRWPKKAKGLKAQRRHCFLGFLDRTSQSATGVESVVGMVIPVICQPMAVGYGSLEKDRILRHLRAHDEECCRYVESPERFQQGGRAAGIRSIVEGERNLFIPVGKAPEPPWKDRIKQAQGHR
jgi:hypothetical protein